MSGKPGFGPEELLRAVIPRIPPPKEHPLSSGMPSVFRALVFDSFYHEHKGVVANVRVFNGSLYKEGQAIFAASQTIFKVKELGHFGPELKPDTHLECGQIGYLATGLKDPSVLKIGDTIIALTSQTRADFAESASLALHGYKEPQPVVFVSFYPDVNDTYEELKNAFGKLKLNDSAIQYEPDFNEFLGRGFKIGFLGKLHFEITTERL